MRAEQSWIVLDVETAAHPDAPAFLEPVQAARNIKDPAKIEADVAEKEASRLADLALDWNLNRIVCLGVFTDQRNRTDTWICRTEADEADALSMLWDIWRADRPHVVGFRLRTFDWPVLIQRSRLLGVPVPPIDLKRWGNRDWTDLSDVLTFDGLQHTKCMKETLDAFCRRFGIVVEDEVRGKDIAALVAAGDFESIAKHCCADVMRTLALARRIGVLPPQMTSTKTLTPSTNTSIDYRDGTGKSGWPQSAR